VEAVLIDPVAVRPLLLQCVLDLEQVREVRVRIDSYGELDRFLGVVQDGELLVEAIPDRPLADHGQLRVDVHGAGPRHQEEPGLEVLQVVDGERVEALAVHGEHPGRQESGIEGEQARRIGERCLDVTARIAHDESVPVEDLDDPVAHDRPPFAVDPRFAGAGGPGRARWNNTSKVGSPSSDTTPRRAPAIAFTLPVTMPSNRSLEVLITASAFALRWETETASFPIVRNQRSVAAPDSRSIRREPFVRGGSVPGPPAESRSKNSSMGSLTDPSTRGGDVPMEPVRAGRAIMPKA
jgi:hypothetical protein